MKKNTALVIVFLLAFVHSWGQNYNTEKNWVAQKPYQHDAEVKDPARTPQEVLLTTEYADGFGRPVQSVARKANPQGLDVVTFRKYDPWGRELQQFLPFVSGNDGNYKTNAEALQQAFNQTLFPGESNFYSLVDLENSPANRVLKTYAPGSGYVGSGRGVTARVWVNTDIDYVRKWSIGTARGSLPTSSGYYSAGSLYKTVMTDEKNTQVIVFKDKSGNEILKKTQLTATSDNGNGSGHAGWLCTYTVYDDYGNQRFIITPKAVNLMDGSWVISSQVADELCYRYEYDIQSRLIVKKNPGTQGGNAGEVWTVYDKRGRIVMLQDGRLRSQQKWQYFQFDDQDRITASGLMYDPVNYQNLDFHLNNAAVASVSPSYPNLASYTTELLSQSYYDDYGWTSGTGLSATMDQTNVNNTTYFLTPSNSSFPYPQEIRQGSYARGRLTGSKTRVLDGSGTQYLFSVTFYDENGRVIQTQGTNSTGGVDKVTTQFSWTGGVVRVLEEHAKNTGVTQSHKILTKMNYSSSARLQSVTKTISSVINSSPSVTTIAGVEKTISAYTYDDLGNVSTKALGTNAVFSPLETQTFTYNVQGKLTGINKNFTQAGNNASYFGEELGYDKTATTAGTTTFSNALFDGNISGVVWKTKGDGVSRKYDYSYDNAGQLTGAGYLQNTSGSVWDKTYIDYSVNSISYDLNGNIKTLNQNGFVLGGGPALDNLVYNYKDNDVSNKLQNVVDNANNPNSKLGDFHYAGSKVNTAVDYTYDMNGSLVSDANKNIASIGYNFLNLPQQVVVTNKGTITYTYDAAGNKLKKVVQENNATVPFNNTNYTTNITTTTTYIGGFSYQSKAFSNPALASLNIADALQYIIHNEGRARIVYPLYGQPAYFAYDYFVKDHLGNVRVTLTDEVQQDTYPSATVETAGVSTEQGFYDIKNDAAHVIPVSTLPWWPTVTNNSYTNNNGIPYPPDPTVNHGGNSAAIYKLNGASGDRFGLGVALKVMAGDKVSVFGKSVWHNSAGSTSNTYFVSGVLTSFINAFAGTNAVTGGSKGLATGPVLNGNTTTTGNLSNLLNNVPNPGGQTPKAYINWVLFDEQFKPVSTGSNVDPVSVTADAVKSHFIPDITMAKSGYLYVYCSNESNQDVYFDNLQVVHKRGAMIEEASYYPYGLAMSGISSKSFGKLKVNFGYQGKEMQNNEFYDGTGLEEYDFAARFYDPQLGRWWAQDPVTMYASPYTAMSNNPTIYADPDGKNPIVVAVIIGAIAGGYTGYKIAEAKGYNLGDLKTWGYMLGGAAIGAASGYAGASITTAGGFMANTMGIMFSSAFSSIGMSALSGGQMPAGMSFGVASVNLETGEWSWLGKKGNSFLENVGYAFGAMANLQDIFAGINGGQAVVKSRKEVAGHSEVGGTHAEDIANADGSITHVEKDIVISVGPEDQTLGQGKGIKWEMEYVKRSLKGRSVKGENEAYIDASDKIFQTKLFNVRTKSLFNQSERLNSGRNLLGTGRLKYGLYWGCVNYTSRSLLWAGVFNFNAFLPITAPVLLNAELALRQIGMFATPYLIRKD